MSAAHRSRSERLVGWLIRHRYVVLIVALLLGVPAGWRTTLTYAALRSDLEELLPESAPSVAALDMMRSRMPGLRYLGIVVDAARPENIPAANRFIDDLSARMAAYPPGLVGITRKDVRAERRFLESRALQLMDPADVRELREAVEKRRDWEVTRAMDLDLLDEDEDPRPKIPIDELRHKYEKRHGKPRQLPEDRFVSEDGRTVVLVVQAASHGTNYESDQALVSRVQADIAGLGFPDAYAAGMRVGFAGDVASRLEEMEGLFEDLAVSGAIVACLVLSVLRWFFGSWRVLLVLAVPLILGTLYTFGMAALPPLSIRHLNTNTGFLGSVIVGNGINTGIILLARFAEERRGGADLYQAIATALRTTWRPTVAAAAAASTAYGSLVFTDFRGFNQFGWIGGLGMVTCWATTLLLAPPLLSMLGTRVGAPNRVRARAAPLQRTLAAVLSHPRWVIGITAGATLAAGLGLLHRGSNWLEHDFSKLRRSDSWVSGERYWGQRMDQTLQRYLTPTVIMVHNRQQAVDAEERVRALLRDDRAGSLIGSVRSVRQILPESRGAAVAEARKLKQALTPRLKAQLKPKDRRMVETALSDDALRPLEAAEVPEVLVAGLREHDGRIDRTVLVYPRLTQEGTWDGQRIRAFTDDLRAAARAADPEARVAGPLTLSSDITTAMKHDGPRATALGLTAALIICTLAFGSLRLSVAAVASLLVGMVLMLGGLAWTRAMLNFSNFVVLPITFGISADYAINVLRRYQAEGSMSARQALASTGGAVAMCSATTIIGFGSLLAAKNQALYSFGVFAVAGELTMLATAALALPAVLALREQAARLRSPSLDRQGAAQ